MTQRHATPRELADTVDGVLIGARRDRVEAHLATGCATCDGALDRTRSLVSAVVAGPLAPPPASVVRRAAGLFAAARRAALVGRVREIVATLVFDQRLAPAAALRGGPGGARRMLWTCDDTEIVVSVSPGATGADLLGECLGEYLGEDDAVPVGSVALDRVGGASRTSALDAEGAFALRGVVSGTYVLRGVVDGLAFRTPPFMIR